MFYLPGSQNGRIMSFFDHIPLCSVSYKKTVLLNLLTIILSSSAVSRLHFKLCITHIDPKLFKIYTIGQYHYLPFKVKYKVLACIWSLLRSLLMQVYKKRVYYAWFFFIKGLATRKNRLNTCKC